MPDGVHVSHERPPVLRALNDGHVDIAIVAGAPLCGPQEPAVGEASSGARGQNGVAGTAQHDLDMDGVAHGKRPEYPVRDVERGDQGIELQAALRDGSLDPEDAHRGVHQVLQHAVLLGRVEPGELDIGRHRGQGIGQRRHDAHETALPLSDWGWGCRVRAAEEQAPPGAPRERMEEVVIDGSADVHGGHLWIGSRAKTWMRGTPDASPEVG